MRLPKPHQCSVCKIVVFSQQQLISHFQAFHCNRHVSTSIAPRAFRYHMLNRNPNLCFPTGVIFYRDRSWLFGAGPSLYREGYFDHHRRFHRGFPPASKVNYVVKKKPKLMDLFPVTSSESDHTLPLLYQLEQRRPDVIVPENGGAKSSHIDLSLRL